METIARRHRMVCIYQSGDGVMAVPLGRWGMGSSGVGKWVGVLCVGGLLLGALPIAVGGPALPRLSGSTLSQKALAPAQAHFDAQRYHKATSHLAGVLEDGLPRQDAAYSRVLMAQSFSAMGLEVAASEAWLEAARLASDTAFYDALLAGWLGEGEKVLGGMALLQGAYDQLPTTASLLESDRLLLLRGLEAWDRGDGGAAVVALEDLSAGSEAQRAGTVLLGIVYADAGLNDKARSAFASLFPGSPEIPVSPQGRLQEVAALGLARLAYAQGREGLADRWYLQVESRPRWQADVLAERAWLRLKRGDFADARQLIERLEEHGGKSREVERLRAWFYALQGLTNDALVHLENHLELLKAERTKMNQFLETWGRDRIQDLGLLLLLESEGSGPLASFSNAASLQKDWRLRDSRILFDEITKERRWLESQMAWWKEEPAYPQVHRLLMSVESRVQTKVGSWAVSQAESGLQDLEKESMDALFLKRAWSRGELPSLTP